MTLTTLPLISLDERIPLEPLRKFVRAHPALSKLGSRVGPGKAYTADEAAEIARAYRAHVAGRAGARVEVANAG